MSFLSSLQPVRTASRATKRTKIVCTIGPASSSEEAIRSLIFHGADVFRLNFSHGTHGDHQNAINLIRHISRDLNQPIGILADLSGPKLRIGQVEGGEVHLVENEVIVLTSDESDGTNRRFQVNFAGFHDVAALGQKVLLDDGNLQFAVERIEGHEVYCRVLVSGPLKPRKGVNLPDTKLPIPALTEKDRVDLAFALRHGVDFIALSFVRSAEDIRQVKDLMKDFGRTVPVLAKIEKKEALENLDAILREANGAMVARGDLGIEIPMQEVPSAQKRIIRICNQLAKPVIVATQMLESMITNPRPTRAEIADIYNAILDGTDAVMLSGETAAGRYPARAVEVMDTVAGEAEKHLDWNKGIDWVVEDTGGPSTTNVICHSAAVIAERLNVDLILVPTQTGYTARHVAIFRPSVPIFAVSTEPEAVNSMCLVWGTIPRLMPALIEEEVAKSASDALVNEVIRTAKRYGIARSGNRAVVLGGLPLGQTRHTNYLRIVEIP